jgi:uncharacterized protein YkwD
LAGFLAGFLDACTPVETRGAESASEAARAAGLEREVHEAVNAHRRGRGLSPLVLDARIGREARLHSVAMAEGKVPLGHHGFEERAKALSRILPSRRSAENVASNEGHRDPASEAVRGWLRSHQHREHIEGPYELTGVGVARNGRGEVYFTQIFIGH